MEPDSNFLSVADFADRVGVSRQAVYKRIRTDKTFSLYVVNEGRRTWIRPEAAALYAGFTESVNFDNRFTRFSADSDNLSTKSDNLTTEVVNRETWLIEQITAQLHDRDEQIRYLRDEIKELRNERRELRDEKMELLQMLRIEQATNSRLLLQDPGPMEQAEPAAAADVQTEGAAPAADPEQEREPARRWWQFWKR